MERHLYCGVWYTLTPDRGGWWVTVAGENCGWCSTNYLARTVAERTIDLK